MKHIIYSASMLAALLFASCSKDLSTDEAVAQAPVIEKTAFVSNAITLKLSEEAAQAIENQTLSRKPMAVVSPTEMGDIVMAAVPSLHKINSQFKAQQVRRLVPDGTPFDAKHRKYGLHLFYEVVLEDKCLPEMAIAAYKADPNIVSAELSNEQQPHASAPNDPMWHLQWNFHGTPRSATTIYDKESNDFFNANYDPSVNIHLLDAWDIVKQSGTPKEVLVAVMDYPIYAQHPDLKAAMWNNPNEIPNNNIDDDHNGYVDDVHGWNFVNSSNDLTPTSSHGTHVAGIIAATPNNNEGISGIIPEGANVKLLSCGMLGGSTSAQLLPIFTYAADNGAVIANNSWGYTSGTLKEADKAAIEYFQKEAGRDANGNPRKGTPMVGGLVIFSAGNTNSQTIRYPQALPNVISVGNIAANGKKASDSNFGDWVSISAPGGDFFKKKIDLGNGRSYESSYYDGEIYSTACPLVSSGSYIQMAGTSHAAPHVTGVAALLLAAYGNENVTAEMLSQAILNSADPSLIKDDMYRSKLGRGMLRADRALIEAQKLFPNAPTSEPVLTEVTTTLQAADVKMNVCRTPAPTVSVNNGNLVIGNGGGLATIFFADDIIKVEADAISSSSLNNFIFYFQRDASSGAAVGAFAKQYGPLSYNKPSIAGNAWIGGAFPNNISKTYSQISSMNGKFVMQKSGNLVTVKLGDKVIFSGDASQVFNANYVSSPVVALGLGCSWTKNGVISLSNCKVTRQK